MKYKEHYLSPQMEIIKIENEGVIAGSINGATLPPLENGGVISGSTNNVHRYNTSDASAIEDMLNDLFTIEQ